MTFERLHVKKIVLVLFLVSCGAVKTGEHAWIDCAKVDAKALAPDLLASTLGVLAAGGDGWRDALSALGTKAGEDALACAVKAARATFAKPASGEAFAANAQASASRARVYETERGWTFAP